MNLRKLLTLEPPAGIEKTFPLPDWVQFTDGKTKLLTDGINSYCRGNERISEFLKRLEDE